MGLVSQLFLRDTRKVLTLTEPQVWVLIGVFALAMFGLIGFVVMSLTRTLAAAIRGVRAEIAGLRDIMDSKFDAVDAKFASKAKSLDLDIQALSRHVFGSDPR